MTQVVIPPPASPPSPSSDGAEVRTAHLPIPRLIKRNTLLLASTQAFVGMGTQLVPTLGPLMVINLLGSVMLAGLATSLSSVAKFLVAYPIGWVMDTYGRKTGLLLGLTLSLVGALTIASSVLLASFPLFVAGVLVFGLGVGAGQQIRVAAADMYLPSRRAEGLGYVLSGSLVGAIGGPLLMTTAQGVGPRVGLDPIATAWLMVPLVLLPSMALVLLVRPDPRHIATHLSRYYPGYVAPAGADDPGEAGGSVRSWLAHYPLKVAFVSTFVVQGVMTMMMAMTSLALSHHGHALPMISVAVAIHVVGMYGLSIPLGRLTDRFGRRGVMLAGLVLSGSGSALIPASSTYEIITAGTFLVGVGWSCVNVAASALIADTVNARERGRAVGTNDTISGTASVVLPLLGGPLVEWAGLPSLAFVALALVAVPMALVWRLSEPRPGVYTVAGARLADAAVPASR